jgi:WD40 repeat protein
MSQQKGPIRCLSWDTHGKRLAAAGNFFTTIYAVPDVSENSPFSPSADAVLSSSPSSLSALPASPKLSSAMSSVSLGAWEEYNGEAGSSSSFLEFSPSGQLFAFDLQRRIGLCTMTESGRGDTKFEVSHLSGHNMPVSAIAWSPDSEYLASGGMDQQLFIWSVGRKRFVQKLKGHVSYIAAVAWSRDAVVSGGGDAKLVFFDPLVGRIKNHVDYHKGAILALDWRPKDQILASTSVDRKVLFMDTRSWAASNVLVFPAAPSRVSFSPDGSYFATSGKDAVRVWSFAEMRQIAIFRGDQVTGSPMSWSSTGRWFATVDDRNLPVVFDMQQFRTIRTRPSSSTKVPDTEPIVSLRWCPRSDMLAVGALDRVVSFWMPRLV